MNKLTLALLVLLIALPAHAGMILRGSNIPPPPGCSTPADGDELNEGFLGAGYEVAGWTEIVGTGGTLNEDATLSGSPPAGSCTEGLLSSVTTSGTATYSKWDRGSAIASASNMVDVYTEFRVNSKTIDNFGNIWIFGWSDSGETYDNGVFNVRLNWSDPTLSINIFGASGGEDQTITAGTWYTLHVHLDTTANQSYFQIDGGSQISFTRGAVDGRYLLVGPWRFLAATEAVAIEWGRIWIDTP